MILVPALDYSTAPVGLGNLVVGSVDVDVVRISSCLRRLRVQVCRRSCSTYRRSELMLLTVAYMPDTVLGSLKSVLDEVGIDYERDCHDGIRTQRRGR